MKVAAVLILLAIPAAGLRQGPAALSTDERAMTSFIDAHNAEGLALLERVVNINSGTQNFEGVAQVGAVFARGVRRARVQDRVGRRRRVESRGPSGRDARRARHRRFC